MAVVSENGCFMPLSTKTISQKLTNALFDAIAIVNFCKRRLLKIDSVWWSAKKAVSLQPKYIKPHRSLADEVLFGRALIGNRVQIPSSPAAVSLVGVISADGNPSLIESFYWEDAAEQTSQKTCLWPVSNSVLEERTTTTAMPPPIGVSS